MCLCHYHAILITIGLYYVLKSGSMMPRLLIFFLKIALAICSLLWFHMNLDCLSNAVKYLLSFFCNNYIESVDCIVWSDCVNNIEFSNEHRVPIHLIVSCLISFIKFLPI
jgi:hypothetical protein